MAKVYGLTGGIGCGKSTVAQFFREEGIPVICADTISREITQKNQEGLKKIKEHFGKEVLNSDGSLNRKKLADIVFSDEKKRNLLEEILHPLIMKKIHEQINVFSEQGKKLILVEAALIFEEGYEKEFDGVIVVFCTREQQIKRLPKEFQKRIETQMPVSEKVKRATSVIDNSGSLDRTKDEVHKLLEKLR